MLNFENVATKNSFISYIETNSQKLKEIDAYAKNRRCWNISDKYGNEWNISYNGIENQYCICNVCKDSCDVPFSVYMKFDTNKITITNAEKAGRKIKSERLLKQFSQLAIMLNCYANYWYLV